MQPYAAHASDCYPRYVGTVSAWRPFDLTPQLAAGSVRCAAVRHLHTAADSLGGHTLAKKRRDVAAIGAQRADVHEQPGPWTHAWPFEHPRSFNAAVLAFLAHSRRA